MSLVRLQLMFFAVHVHVSIVLTSYLRLVFTRRSRNRSRKRSRKSAYDLAKMKNRSRKQSHRADGIGVGRIRTFPFSSDSAYDSET